MSRSIHFILFFLFYVKEVVVANFQIAWQILRPASESRQPTFLAVSVEGLNDRQLLIVTNLITMTPGTLSFDVSADRRTALIHQLVPGGSREKDRLRFEMDYVGRVRKIF